VLEWPHSPYYELIEDTETPRAEPATALLRDGRRLIGSLTRFDSVDGVFEMLPQGGELIEIAPQDLLELRLTRSVMLRRRRSVLDDRPTNRMLLPNARASGSRSPMTV